MHVRLINPFIAVIHRLDTNATAATDGGKPGYNRTFREPDVKMIDGQRVDARVEKNAVRVAVQVEDRAWAALRAYDSGIDLQVSLALVADYQALKKDGHVDCTTGSVLFNPNDRLDRIEDMRGNTVTVVRTPPGLYCLEVRPLSYGIGRKLNLVLWMFEARSHTPKR